ncbi:hypothetical protein BG004_001431, partial [Podila humilis]
MSKIDNARSRSVLSTQLSKTHIELCKKHLTVIESGSIPGLERLLGDLLVTDSNTLEILGVEVDNRDPLVDPHAESMSAFPSSIPTDGPGTQYPGDLKIALLTEKYNNKKLVIGVRGANYLVTACDYDGTILVGPGRCSTFPVNRNTKLLIKKTRQDEELLRHDLLGLAQVRSAFGNSATYSPRRAALRGYASVS